MMLSGDLRLKAIKCHDSGMKKSAEMVGQKWAKMLCQEPRSAAYQWSGPCDAKLEILVPSPLACQLQIPHAIEVIANPSSSYIPFYR
jgi:hypothetical protein